MISPQQAWDILACEVAPLGAHSLPLAQARGQYLAEPVLANADIPPADRAAMDGYVFRRDHLAGSVCRLIVDGEICAGSADAPPAVHGHCHRIFTGANVPPGADTVVAVEQTSTRSFRSSGIDAEVDISELPEKGANIFRRGENARAGTLLLPAGTRLDPRRIGLAAATGHALVRVHRRPRVRVLNTGAELLDVDTVAAAHQTYNSNGPMLLAALSEAGFQEVDCETVPDDLKATTASVSRAVSEADAVILTGGISAGLHDYVPQALSDLGARILYRGIGMKPGKPQLFARSKDGKPIFGLPGNPLSSIVGFYELVLPGLRRLAGRPADECRPTLTLPLAEAAENGGDRFLVLPAQICHGDSGSNLRPCRPIGSADLVTGAKVDGAILLPPRMGRLAAGTPVEFRPWGGLFQ